MIEEALSERLRPSSKQPHTAKPSERSKKGLVTYEVFREHYFPKLAAQSSLRVIGKILNRTLRTPLIHTCAEPSILFGELVGE